jgi:hypothetical protein
MAALATDLARPAILDAIRARRTYALTGDRIEVGFTVDGEPMGSTIRSGRDVEVAWDVRGRDELDVVEIVQDGAVVRRDYARDVVPEASGTGRLEHGRLAEPFQVRLEWGWGPWTALALDRITDWRLELTVERGRILRVFPCLQSGPFDEARRHRFERTGDDRLGITSYTSRKAAYRENPNQSVVLEVAGGPDTAFDLALTEPVKARVVSRAADLFRESANLSVGPFPQESYQWHRIVPRASSAVAGRCSLPVPDGRSSLYLRAKQRNGHMAWASPVFVNY